MLPSELRLALRLLLRRPAASILVVLALGLGIGLSATMFSVVEGIFPSRLPFAGGERFVQLDCQDLPAGIERMPARMRDYLHWRKAQQKLEDLAAWAGVAVVASGPEALAERYNGAYVSSNLFALLGVAPALGRTFSEAESAGQEPVVLVSNAIWKSRLGGTRDAVGRTLKLNGESRTVVGIMPEGFQFPLSQDFWLPLPPGPESPIGLQGFGKLRPGVSLAEAQAELDGLARQLALAYPETNAHVGVVVRPYVEAYSDPEMRSYLRILLFSALGVLLVACANSANLLLSRAALRNEEMAVRQALGSGRAALARQVLGESLCLALAGGLTGAALAAWASRLLQQAIKPVLRSFWVDIRLDGAVLAFVSGITLLAALLAGLYPAVRASRPDLMGLLREQARGRGGPRPGRLGRALVIAQVGVSCGLLVGTGLLLKSAYGLAHVDLGYAPEGLLFAPVSLPGATYPEPDGWSRYFARLADRLEAAPGVRAFTLGSALPGGTGDAWTVRVEGGGDPARRTLAAQAITIRPGYFGMFGIGLLAGRELEPADDARAPAVAVVNESFARRCCPGGDAVGRRVRQEEEGDAGPWRTIVGVVPDLKSEGLPARQRGFLPLIDRSEAPPDPAALYVPVAQNPRRSLALAVRAAGPPATLAPVLRGILAAADPEIPVPKIETPAEQIAEATWDYRLFSAVFTVLGVVALALAAIGLYGVVALSVNARTAEFGLRSALGAPPGDALRLALRDGLGQLGAGVLLGLALALASSRLLSGLLYRVTPWDPAIFLGVAAVLAATGLAACLVPARRATRVDPLQAMRAS